MSAHRQQLLDWVASGDLDASKLEQALALSNSAPSAPSASANLRFLSRVVLAFAVLLLCSGLIFFFAYNWDDLSRYNKFAIAQTAVLLSLLPLLWVDIRQPAGQASLFAASLLVGALLALVGQTYQSGADSYQLFLVWAVLIAPWVMLTKMPALCLLLLALFNLSLVLALNDLEIDRLLVPFTHPGWSLFALNASAAGLWLIATQYLPQTRLLRWAGRIISLYSLLILTFLAIGYIYSWSNSDALTLPVWTGFSALWLYLYRVRQLDLMMLSALIMASIVLLISILAHALADYIPFDGLFLLLALTVMGLSSAAAVWLKRLNQHALVLHRASTYD